MLNQANDHSWIPSSAWRRFDFLEQKKFAPKKVDPLDDVPVMLATVLGLEILLHEPCIDLGMATELILSDVGATIQILRLVGKEYEFAAEHPSRMGDCISSLDSSTWFDAISARTFACDGEHTATTSLWNHCRLVAQYAQLVAESLDGICPEEAYLVGLLHEIKTIPNVLGWPNTGLGDRESVVLAAMEGSLPLFVLSAIRSVNNSSSSSSSTWSFILNAAHELAEARTAFDGSSLHEFDPLTVGTCS
jgi:HDOD domain